MRSKSKASSVQSTATRVSAGAAKKYSSDEERDLKVNINCLVHYFPDINLLIMLIIGFQSDKGG